MKECRGDEAGSRSTLCHGLVHICLIVPAELKGTAILAALMPSDKEQKDGCDECDTRQTTEDCTYNSRCVQWTAAGGSSSCRGGWCG